MPPVDNPRRRNPSALAGEPCLDGVKQPLRTASNTSGSVPTRCSKQTSQAGRPHGPSSEPRPATA